VCVWVLVRLVFCDEQDERRGRRRLKDEGGVDGEGGEWRVEGRRSIDD